MEESTSQFEVQSESPGSFRNVEEEVHRIQQQQDEAASIRSGSQLASGVLIAGILCLIGAGIWAFDTWQFQQKALSVQGTVLWNESWKGKRTSRNIDGVEYVVGGKKHVTRISDSGENGQTVALLVDKNDPTDARKPASLWTDKYAVGISELS